MSSASIAPASGAAVSTPNASTPTVAVTRGASGSLRRGHRRLRGGDSLPRSRWRIWP
jgi:hypothetical protein